jgi:hypothetical protein
MSGFVSLTGPELRDSTFLIPYFNSDSSNWLFAQELDENRIIVGFRRFDPFRYDVINDKSHPSIERQVGDPGVLAYFRPGESVVVDEVHALSQKLQEKPPTTDEPVTFEIDACYVTRDFGRLRTAIHRASIEFGREAQVEKWALIETSLAGAREREGRLGRDLLELEIEKLRSDFDAYDWDERWKTLWGSSSHDDRVTQLAIDYAKDRLSTQSNIGQLARVLGTLSRASDVMRGRFRPTVDALGLQYIELPLKNMPMHSRALSDIWTGFFLRSLHSNVPLPPEKARVAIEFLKFELALKKAPKRNWAEIWNLLWRSPKHKQEAMAVLGLALRQLSSSKLIKSKVIEVIDANLSASETLSVGEEWLSNAGPRGNAWAKIYIRLLNASEGRQDLVDLGWNWLQNDAGNLRGWPEVYYAMLRYRQADADSNKLLKDWLLRANRSMTVWPRMAAEFLKNNSDDAEAIQEAVREWLRQSPDKAETWDLSVLSLGKE